MELLGNRLREIRQQHNLSVRQLAKRIGCHYSLISKIENQKLFPSYKTMLKIAYELNRPVEEIFFQPCGDFKTPDKEVSLHDKTQEA